MGKLVEALRRRQKALEDHKKAPHQPYEKVWADADRDHWLIADEAKEYGMIDEILRRNPEQM